MVAQICLKRGSSSACLGIRNIWADMDKYGCIWACEDAQFSRGYLGANVHPYVRHIWACRLCKMCAQILREFWVPMRYVWPHVRGRFMGVQVVWRWVRKMGAPTMRHPCPGHVDMPIFAPPLPTKLFAHELRFTRQVFQKFLAKMFGNQSVTSIYLQCPKSRSAGVEITTISSLK